MATACHSPNFDKPEINRELNSALAHQHGGDLAPGPGYKTLRLAIQLNDPAECVSWNNQGRFGTHYSEVMSLNRRQSCIAMSCLVRPNGNGAPMR